MERNNAERSRSMWAGVLVRTGMMAAIDEITFHQLLSWHQFYDRSTTEVGLLSDGLLHAAELIAIVAGVFMLFDLIRSRSLIRIRAWAGFFLGLGGFQLFDGLVNHKVLRLHQIRYVDNLLPYDLSWNSAGFILLLIGAFLIRRAINKENEGLANPPKSYRP